MTGQIRVSVLTCGRRCSQSVTADVFSFFIPASLNPSVLFLFDSSVLPITAPVLGLLAALLTWLGTRQAFWDLELPPGRWPAFFGLAGLVLGTVFVWAVLEGRVQSTPEVIPPEGARQARVIYHLSLIVLLLIITATDLKSYFILEWCCWLGLAIGLGGAVLSGQFQLAHAWVDWNAEIPQLRGPEIPEWIRLHPHLHGCVWSLAGAGCGYLVTWLTRRVAAFLLQAPALGYGDVLLMGMAGAYLGWQPTLVALLLAPCLAVCCGILVRLFSNRPALPYGPFLAGGVLIVLFCWQRIWMIEIGFSSHGVQNRATTFALRRFFGDPVALVLVFGLSLGLLVGLLGLLRIYRALPGKTSSQ